MHPAAALAYRLINRVPALIRANLKLWLVFICLSGASLYAVANVPVYYKFGNAYDTNQYDTEMAACKAAAIGVLSIPGVGIASYDITHVSYPSSQDKTYGLCHGVLIGTDGRVPTDDWAAAFYTIQRCPANSTLSYGVDCQCNSGYLELGTSCIPFTPDPGPLAGRMGLPSC